MEAKVTLSDEALRRQILAALGRNGGTRHVNVDVDVSDGVATLTGRLEGWVERLSIERTAHAVKGVRSLVFDLDVRAETARSHSDRQIALAAVRTLKWNSVVPAEDLQLDVEDGLVTLRCEVEWDFHRSIAEDTVRGISGGVRDKLNLRPRSTLATVARLFQRRTGRGA